MGLQYVGLKEINGPLVVLDNVDNASFDEVVEIRLDDGTQRLGRVVEISGKRVVLQVFEGTKGLSMTNTRTKFSAEFSAAQESLSTVLEIFSPKRQPISMVTRSTPFPVHIRETISTRVSPLSMRL